MEDSSSTTSSLNRYEYRVTRTYSAHAENLKNADRMFVDAEENHGFDDNIIIASEMIERIETNRDGGESKWVWDSTMSRWLPTKYTLS